VRRLPEPCRQMKIPGVSWNAVGEVSVSAQGKREHMQSRKLFTAALLLASPAFACSIAPSYMPFEHIPEPPSSPVSTPPPQISVDGIRRGHAGDAGMCADIGFLSLKVPTDPAGFRFELVEGNLPVRFPQGFIKPRKPGVLGFIWSDGNTDAHEPIHAIVKVTAVSSAGVMSEPLLLKIDHPGVAPGR